MTDRPDCSCWHHIGKYDCPVHKHRMQGVNCTGCGHSIAEIDLGLTPLACPGTTRRVPQIDGSAKATP